MKILNASSTSFKEISSNTIHVRSSTLLLVPSLAIPTLPLGTHPSSQQWWSSALLPSGQVRSGEERSGELHGHRQPAPILPCVISLLLTPCHFFLCSSLRSSVISTVWSALSRTPVNYFREPHSAGASLLDEPLLSPTGENRPSLVDILEEGECILAKPPTIVQAFDAYTNVSSIFSFQLRKGPFAAFDCLRACSAIWVILGHTLFWESFYPVQPQLITPSPDR